MLENLSWIMYGFSIALTFKNLFAAFLGAAVGLFVGIIPGLGGITGISILLPLTFHVHPTTAIIFLAALYYSTMYGGAYSAILINIPGDSPAVMTAIDGYKMTKQGRGGKALAAATISSFIGGTLGILILTILGPTLAEIGLKFGSPELALLVLFAMTSIGWMLGEDIAGGLLATGIGVMLATVGVDQAVGISRYDFGQINLLSGISFIPLIIGVFGFCQVIEMVVTPALRKGGKTAIGFKECSLNKKEMKRILPTTIRQGILGTFIGVMPGSGATTSSFLSYIMEKKINRNKESIGEGAIEGIAAAESSNNAAAAGAMAPLLTLGISGGATTAVLLGGLTMWGLNPGPMLFADHPDFAWPLISSMYIANIICIVLAFVCIPLLMKAVSVPTSVMAPIITAVCVIAAYTSGNNMFDVYLMIILGVFAYFLKIANISTTPLLLAFVLTPMLEKYIRQSFDMSAGNLSIFYRNGICWTFILLILAMMISPLVKRVVATKSKIDK